MSFTNIRKYFGRIFITAVTAVGLLILFWGMLPDETAAQPTFYPQRDNYTQNYPQMAPPWGGSGSGEIPLPSAMPFAQAYPSSYSSYPQSGYGNYNNNYSNYNGYGNNEFGGWSDFTSMLGFRMPASGLELLIVVAMYGFRYISSIQKRLKDGDDTILTRIDANEIRQNEELEKVLSVLDTFRRETYEAHQDLNRKMDGVLNRPAV